MTDHHPPQIRATIRGATGPRAGGTVLETRSIPGTSRTIALVAYDLGPQLFHANAIALPDAEWFDTQRLDPA